jgi:lysylphosphatidylglycerol synthetase-like protein (DUF2156 family)
MVSKDQAIGWLICLVCVVVAVWYTLTVIWPEQVFAFLNTSALNVRLWLTLVPVYIAFIAILAIGAWIGWTMATTPPPKPIEEIEAETKIEETEEEEEKE